MDKPVMQKTLADLKPGQSGVVVAFLGGAGVAGRLQAMGLHPGKKVTKVSAMFLHGPVVVDLEHSKIALGLGLADKVLVEVQS